MRGRKWAVAVCLFAAVFAVAGCSPVNTGNNEGVPSDPASSAPTVVDRQDPQIKSADTVMGLYFDISLYDEENYAQVYLGKKFAFQMTYAGSQMTVPTTYKEMVKKGWALIADGGYTEDSLILAGDTTDVQFVNEYGNQITASFFNDSKSSVRLSKCDIVKLSIAENSLYHPESVYTQFWLNGVTNQSALTDVIEYLGPPSHFYAVTPTEYYLDYFLTAADKRNGITLYVSVEDDCINTLEVADYR